MDTPKKVADQNMIKLARAIDEILNDIINKTLKWLANEYYDEFGNKACANEDYECQCIYEKLKKAMQKARQGECYQKNILQACLHILEQNPDYKKMCQVYLKREERHIEKMRDLTFKLVNAFMRHKIDKILEEFERMKEDFWLPRLCNYGLDIKPEAMGEEFFDNHWAWRNKVREILRFLNERLPNSLQIPLEIDLLLNDAPTEEFFKITCKKYSPLDLTEQEDSLEKYELFRILSQEIMKYYKEVIIKDWDNMWCEAGAIRSGKRIEERSVKHRGKPKPHYHELDLNSCPWSKDETFTDIYEWQTIIYGRNNPYHDEVLSIVKDICEEITAYRIDYTLREMEKLKKYWIDSVKNTKNLRMWDKELPKEMQQEMQEHIQETLPQERELCNVIGTLASCYFPDNPQQYDRKCAVQYMPVVRINLSINSNNNNKSNQSTDYPVSLEDIGVCDEMRSYKKLQDKLEEILAQESTKDSACQSDDQE